MDGWVAWQFYIIFNRISVISGQWEGDYDGLDVVKPHFLPPVGPKSPGSMIHCWEP